MGKRGCTCLLIALLGFFEIEARNIHAISASLPDVQVAIDSAADGDVVILTEDTAFWTAAATVPYK